MCTIALGIAAASAVASIGGSAITAARQSSVANAQMQAATAAQQAQDTSFWTRLNAQGAQNQRDYATEQASIAAQNAAAAQQQQQENAATQQRQAVIDQQNQTAAGIQQRAQQQVQQTEQQASPENQAAAVAKQQQDVATLTSQVYSGATGTTPGGPTAPAPSADAETQSAIATRLAQAAANTRSYAQGAGTLASYGAPITATTLATRNLATGTAPLTTQQQVMETSTPNLLGPSSVAYQNAGNYYQNLLDAIQQRTKSNLNISQAIASGNITNADLAQADAVTEAQNKLTWAQYQAATSPTGTILSGVGQAGAYAAGAMGAGNQAASWLGGGGSGAGPGSQVAGFLSGLTGQTGPTGFGAPAVGTQTITPYWRGLMSGSAV